MKWPVTVHLPISVAEPLMYNDPFYGVPADFLGHLDAKSPEHRYLCSTSCTAQDLL